MDILVNNPALLEPIRDMSLTEARENCWAQSASQAATSWELKLRKLGILLVWAGCIAESGGCSR